MLERIKRTWQHLIVDRLENELMLLSKEKEALKEKAQIVRTKYEKAVKELRDKC